MFFNLTNCPDGWSPLVDARGRVLVGLQPGGRPGGTVGAELGDLQDRGHTHTVDPPTAWTAEAPNHTHQVDIGSFYTSGSAALPEACSASPPTVNVAAAWHTHWLPPTFRSTSADGVHVHGLDLPATSATLAYTSDVIPYIQLLVCEKD